MEKTQNFGFEFGFPDQGLTQLEKIMIEYSEKLYDLRITSKNKIAIKLSLKEPKIINKPVLAGLMSDISPMYHNPNEPLVLIHVDTTYKRIVLRGNKYYDYYIDYEELSLADIIHLLYLDHYYHFIEKKNPKLAPLYNVLSQYWDNDFSTLIYAPWRRRIFTHNGKAYSLISVELINDLPTVVITTDKDTIKVEFPSYVYKDNNIELLYSIHIEYRNKLIDIMRKRIEFYDKIIPVLKAYIGNDY